MGVDAEKLASYERMQRAVGEEYESTLARLEVLRMQGKAKTATYQQLFARKMNLQFALSLYERYGLQGDSRDSR